MIRSRAVLLALVPVPAGLLLAGYIFWPRTPSRSPAEMLPADAAVYAEFRTYIPPGLSELLAWWQTLVLPMLFPRGSAAVGFRTADFEPWAALFLPGGGGRYELLAWVLKAVETSPGIQTVPFPRGDLTIEEREGWVVFTWGRVRLARYSGPTLADSAAYRKWRRETPDPPDFLSLLIPGRTPGWGQADDNAGVLRVRLRLGGQGKDFPAVPVFPGPAALDVQLDHPRRVLDWPLPSGIPIPPPWAQRWVRPELRQCRLSLESLAAILSIPVPTARAWLGFSDRRAAGSFLADLIRSLGSEYGWTVSRAGNGSGRLDFSYLRLLGFSVEEVGSSLAAVCPSGDSDWIPPKVVSPPGVSLLIRLDPFRIRVAPALGELLGAGFSLVGSAPAAKGLEAASRLWSRAALRCEESGGGMALSLELSWRGED